MPKLSAHTPHKSRPVCMSFAMNYIERNYSSEWNFTRRGLFFFLRRCHTFLLCLLVVTYMASARSIVSYPVSLPNFSPIYGILYTEHYTFSKDGRPWLVFVSVFVCIRQFSMIFHWPTRSFR